MARRKRRRAVVTVEEQSSEEVANAPMHHPAQKRLKASCMGDRAVAGAVAPAAVAAGAAAASGGDAGTCAAANRKFESAETLDDPRLAPCFGVAMRSLGLERPTTVQSRCWPVCTAGRDAIVIAPTGSGKTLGYIMPAVAVCLQSDGEESNGRPGASPIAVVVCPTRELAQQVHRVCRPFARLYKLHAVCATGGIDKAKQMEELHAAMEPFGPPQLLVGTPGRLHDLLGGLSREEREQQLHEEWEQLQRKLEHTAQPENAKLARSTGSAVPTVGARPQLHADVAPVAPENTMAHLSFAHVRLLILDEMDKLLSMGNNYELQTIRSACAINSADALPEMSSSIRTLERRKVQVLLFSATLPAVLESAVAQWVTDPVRVSSCSTAARGKAVHANEGSALNDDSSRPDDGDANRLADDASATVTESDPGLAEAQEQKGVALQVAASVTQVVHVCADHKKPKKLLTFVGKIRAEEKQNGARSKARILIFCNRIKTAKFVESMLRKNNQFCKQMSSAMNQTQRERTLNEFRSGKLPMLVATDVAGRGLDVRGLDYVVNYDFPSRLEVYVHRVGRTGRQGAAGHSYSFFGRHLSVLAPELISLLEASDQWVDPNLRALLPRDAHTTSEPRHTAAPHEDSESHSSDGLEQWSSDDD